MKRKTQIKVFMNADIEIVVMDMNNFMKDANTKNVAIIPIQTNDFFYGIVVYYPEPETA